MAGLRPGAAARVVPEVESFAGRVGRQLPLEFRNKGRFTGLPETSAAERALPQYQAAPRLVDMPGRAFGGETPGQLGIPGLRQGGGELVPITRNTPPAALPSQQGPTVYGMNPSFRNRMMEGQPLESYRGTLQAPEGPGVVDFGVPQPPGVTVSPGLIRASQRPQIMGTPEILNSRPFAPSSEYPRAGQLGRPVDAYEQVTGAGRDFYNPQGQPMRDFRPFGESSAYPRGGPLAETQVPMRGARGVNEVKVTDVTPARAMADAIDVVISSSPAKGLNTVSIPKLLGIAGLTGLGAAGLVTGSRRFMGAGAAQPPGGGYGGGGGAPGALDMPAGAPEGGAESPTVAATENASIGYQMPAIDSAYTDPVSQTVIRMPGDGGASALLEQKQQYAAPLSQSLGSFYGAQQKAGEQNIEAVIDRLGARGTPLEKWARSNEGLAYREVLRQQEHAQRTDLNARTSFPAPQELQPVGISQQTNENVQGQVITAPIGSDLSRIQAAQPTIAAEAAVYPTQQNFEMRDTVQPMAQPTLMNSREYEAETPAREQDLAKLLLDQRINDVLGYMQRA